jgi:microcystin-dependent protein
VCAGGSFSGATYPELAAVLGSTTLPDLRDRVPVGVSGSKAVKSAGGSATAALGWSNVPQHVHTGVDHLHSAGAHEHTISSPISLMQSGSTAAISVNSSATAHGNDSGRSNLPVTVSGSTNAGSGNTGAADRSLTTGPGNMPTTPFTALTATGTAFSTQNPYVALNFIIRAAA